MHATLRQAARAGLERPATTGDRTGRGRAAWRAGLLVAGLAALVGGCARAEEPAKASTPLKWGPFAHAPLDTPLTVTASFGEYRSGHFHAGLDFSTQQQVGLPVYAPLPGWVRRVRASGAGYGRGLYFQADDGRLFVFGHLDAFAEPVRSRLAALQDSTGEYEQDLTFLSQKIRYAAGDTIAWSGQSGAGPPHLHMEVRRVDMAIHPLETGLAIPDTMPPRLVRLILEPLDDTSFVAIPASGAVSLAIAANDTPRVAARGRFRAVLEAYDPREDGAGRLAPFDTRIAEWNQGREDWFVECRFDSASWAGDMPEVEFVYDRGRASPGRPAIVLWAPAGFRPRMYHTSAPIDREAGTIEIDSGAAPRELAIAVVDPAGNAMRRAIRLEAVQGPRPAPARATAKGARAQAVADRGAAFGMTRAAATVTFENGARVELPESAMFAPETLRAQVVPVPPIGAGWQHVGTAVRVTPAFAALRSPVTVRMPLPPGIDVGRVGIVRYDGEWSWLGAHADTVHHIATSDSRRLGTFALLRDVRPPRLFRFHVRPDAVGVPYSRWAIELRAVDGESGLDSGRSYFTVNGRRVPTELDPDARMMRWRPLAKPAPGPLHVEALATDEAGNTTRLAGTLVVR